MATLYDSSRTGQAHDNDENRLTTLENTTNILDSRTDCLSSSGTTGQFLRGDKTWSNSLTGKLNLSGYTVSDGDASLNIQTANALPGTIWNYTIQSLVPGMTNGLNNKIGFGKAHSSLNAAGLVYHHVADGSSDNYCSLGFHSNDWVLNVIANSRVGINTTTPSWPLHVNGKMGVLASFDDSNGGIRAIDTGSGAWRYAYLGSCPNASAGQKICISLGKEINAGNCACWYYEWNGNFNANNRMGLEFHNTGTRFYVTLDGRTYANSYNTISKREYKTNILEYLGNAGDLIKTIKIFSFNFKDALHRDNIGFIADDTHEIFAGKEHDRMDINNCIGMLLKAVLELSAENEELKLRISKLELVIDNG